MAAPMIRIVFAACFLCGADGAFAANVTHAAKTVNGVLCDVYTWVDSQGLKRSVSLKREGGGNPGHGGYAVQMTYETPAHHIITADSDTDEGFGYFVSHERYRDFTDGANDTIASHIFHTDDSPLGRGFKVVGKALPSSDKTQASHQFTTSYPRYGTIAPIKKDANGDDVKKSPIAKSAYQLYHLPVTITWFFESGKDSPRIETKVGFGDIPGPDRANFDVRGPYGVLRFDNDTDKNVTTVIWGDRFHFITLDSPVTRGSGWTWNAANRGARYTALIAGSYEMGLYEPKKFAQSALRDGYADERGMTSTTYRNGKGCDGEAQLIPCDWEWPYQSLQYSLPNDKTTPSNYKKIAWGSSPYYGTGPSLRTVFDSPNTSENFNGYPASKAVTYSICVVLGQTEASGLTRAAAAGPTYSCAGLP